MCQPHKTQGLTLEERAPGTVTKVATLLVATALLVACGSELPSPQTTSASGNTPGEPSAQSSDQADQAAAEQQGSPLYLASEILEAASVSDELAKAMDSAEFMVTGLRASIMATAQASVPVVSFQAVEAADFYQILRCSGDSSLIVDGIDLSAGLSSSSNITTWISALKSKPVWEQLVKLPQCTLIQSTLTRPAFIDHDTVLDGPVRYIARACSAGSIAMSTLPTESAWSCSKLLSISEIVTAQAKKIDDAEQVLRQEIHALRKLIDQKSLDLAAVTRDYAKSVIECEASARKENLAKHRKDLLLAVLGIGARIGAEVLSSGGTNPLTTIKSIWQDKEALKRETRPVVDVLKDVFATEKATIKECAATEWKASRGRELLVDLFTQSKTILELARTLRSGAQEILR